MTNEILLEAGAETGKKYTYTYDQYGNILSKKEEEYTVSTEATSNAVTKQYTYGDSTWKDLLTGFGELTYTYDEIGNVIRTENTRTEEVTEYSWSKGQKLFLWRETADFHCPLHPERAPIVILDKATASVDPENEHLIQEAISELTHGKTIITIAHRLAKIENAGQIFVIDNGSVAQKGTQEQLLK